MKSNVGGIRLKLGTAVDSQPAAQLPYDQQKTGHVGARVLATRIAAHTVKVLLEGEMLDPASASDQLRNYESNLGKELNIGQCILRFLFPDEGRLAIFACTRREADRAIATLAARFVAHPIQSAER